MQSSQAGGGTGSATPAGWYADPSAQWAWRWWDGDRWTEHVSAGTTTEQGPAGHPGYAAHPGYPGFPSAYDRFADQQKAAPWARRALMAYAVVVVAGLLITWAEYATLHQVLHLLRVEIDTGVRQPQPTRSPELTILSLVLSLVRVGIYVMVPVWQYRATKTAQALGIPARLSPGLGVGGWFIPVVNLWFPYQAIVDCLPPGDPGRRTVLRMWVMLLAATVLGLATVVLVVVYGPAAFATAALQTGAAIAFACYAVRATRLIARTHQGLLYPGRPDLAVDTEP